MSILGGLLGACGTVLVAPQAYQLGPDSSGILDTKRLHQMLLYLGYKTIYVPQKTLHKTSCNITPNMNDLVLDQTVVPTAYKGGHQLHFMPSYPPYKPLFQFFVGVSSLSSASQNNKAGERSDQRTARFIFKHQPVLASHDIETILVAHLPTLVTSNEICVEMIKVGRGLQTSEASLLHCCLFLLL